MIKPIDESLLKNLKPQVAIEIKYHDQMASKFPTEGEVNDDFLPGLGDFEAFWGILENGITFSVLTHVGSACPLPTCFEIHTEKKENVVHILKELEIPKTAILWEEA